MSMLKTEDDYTFSNGEILAEVGQYANKEWYIRPHKVSKYHHMFTSSNYYINYNKAYEYYKQKKALTN